MNISRKKLYRVWEVEDRDGVEGIRVWGWTEGGGWVSWVSRWEL